MTLAAPLKFHGGKAYLVNKLHELMPKTGIKHRVETHGGGARWTLSLDPEGFSEVINDIDGDVSNFWETIRDENKFSQFKRMCEATPFSQVEWDDSEPMLDSFESDDFTSNPCGRAWAFFVHCRQSMAGRMKSFSPLSRTRTRRGMNEQASSWLTAIEGLQGVHERLKRVVVLSQDACKVIQQQDGPETLFYCDPPYYPSCRTAKSVYQHEMTPDQHIELLATLEAMQGRFMLSGYRHAVYDEFAKSCNWRRVDFSLPNNAASGKSKRHMTECVWMNYEG